MLARIVWFLLLLLSAASGYWLASSVVWQSVAESFGIGWPVWPWIGTGIGVVIAFLLWPPLEKRWEGIAKRFMIGVQKTPIHDILAGALGLVAGLLIAILLTLRLPRDIPIIGEYLPVVVTMAIGYIGLIVFVRKKDELFQLIGAGDKAGPTAHSSGNAHKLLDTSVIIDGRIADIARTGFLEGSLLIPGFVLQELQHIADSSDVLKRNRGRRGLDILNRMQKDSKVTVQILDDDFDDLYEVDAKLVRLAQLKDAQVLTNDFNLNKVAELQGVGVLNINELANAVKPVVLPGEEMVVQVIKDGKEQGQGVGYLDDGTMIVIDGGRRFIGESIGVLVTSVLQTAAGRMIFAKPKPMEQAL